MKAIRVDRHPTVLSFNFEGERLDALRSLCDRLSVGHVNYSAGDAPEAFALPLGDLLVGRTSAADALPDDARAALAALAFPDELLYLANLTEQTLNAVLTGLREAGLSVPLKAVATPTNTEWRPMALRSELMEEHAAMEAYRKAQAEQAAGDE